MTADVQAPPAPLLPTPLAEPSLAELALADGVRFLLAMFVDLTGKPCAKLVPVESADELQSDGVGFAGYAVGAIGQQPCDPDLIAIPDVSSSTPLPWVRDGLALVHCDPHVEGTAWHHAPRVILQEILERARARQLELFAGADALTTADRVITARYLISMLAEQRGGDGATNPYLALAEALAAGLDGLEREIDPGAPGSGPDATVRAELPPTLLHAVDALGLDPVVTGGLDAAGPGVAEYFAARQRDEFFDGHGTVGSWQHDQDLTAF